MSDHDPKTKKPTARRKKAAPAEPASSSADKIVAAKSKPRAKGTAVTKPTAVVAARSSTSGEAAPVPVASGAKSAKSSVKARAAPKRRGKRAAAMKLARFAVGDVVRHRYYPFRGVVFDIDPVFANTEEWWLAIPEEIRPAKDQPFYHLLAENAETEYVAYVSEQNLTADQTGKPLRHPRIAEMFEVDDDGSYRAVFLSRH